MANGEYQTAYETFLHLECSERTQECCWEWTVDCLERGDYDKAYELMGSVGDYQAIRESRYQRALAYMEEESYQS